MQSPFELPRSDSTFAKDSTISKRKKIAVAVVAAIVVVAAIIGLAVGVSVNKKDHKDTKTTAPAPGPAPTAPAGVTSKAQTASTIAFEKQLYAAHANKTNPEVLEKFLTAVTKEASKLSLITKIPDFSKMNVTANNLLLYIRDFNIQSVIDALIAFADTQDLSAISDLPDLLDDIKDMLSPDAFKKWGKLLADGHIHKANSSEEALSPTNLIKLAKEAKKSLPTPNVSTAALQSAIKAAKQNKTVEPLTTPAGRKLLQDTFQPACLPVVFHVLQYESTGGYFPGTTDLGTGEYLVSRLNHAFSNTEYHQYFDQVNDVPSGITFRLGGVRDDPSTDPHLLVSDGATWGDCHNQDNLMQSIAASINANYPPTEYVNVIVCGQPGEGGSGVLGYAWVPGPNGYPEDWQGSHIFLRTDEFRLDMNNNDGAYNRGGWTLAHELGHHLGLHHPHSKTDCEDGDGLTDTSTTLVVQLTDYYPALIDLCSYWRTYGTWYDQPHNGWTLGQMSSCDPADDIDPVFNVMEYTHASCSSHFTPQQVQILQQAVPYFRPTLYQNGVNAAGQCTASSR